MRKPHVKMMLDGARTEKDYNGVKRLHGTVLNHPFLGTDDIVTSGIRSISSTGKVVRTRNTVYILVKRG